MQRQPISVTTLSNYIKQVFDAESLLRNIDVIGEISSFSISGKNAFFTIKDENALLPCVLFGADEFYTPKIGDRVIVTGTPKYYVKGGKLNFNAISIKPYGEGELFKRFLELKNRLENEGLFDIAHKKPMPKKIERIGVITSENGAVIQDIINVVTRRNAAQDIVLYPIKVQGIGADAEIAKALDFFSEYDAIDAVIVGRGGGSEEDLMNFNSETVARAVYNCKKFVVSAVGHETNYTLCDYVADLRAPTPSAAAELLTKDEGERRQTLKLMIENIVSKITTILETNKLKLDRQMDNITNTINSKMQSQSVNLQIIGTSLKKANPYTILKLGYAKIESEQNSITSAKEVHQNDNLKVFFFDGMANVEVKGVELKNGLRKEN